MNYQVKIAPQALSDIQEITNWYNKIEMGLGERFQKSAILHVDDLCKQPQIFAIRYKSIRCKLIKKFPYMIHFNIKEETKTIHILAVINTSRNPDIGLSKIKSK